MPNRKLPECGEFEGLAAIESGDKEDNMRPILQSVVSGDLKGTKSEKSKLTSLGVKVPWQTMALLATERGQADVLTYCFESSSAVNVDADMEEAADKGLTQKTLAVLLDHGYPQTRSLTTILERNMLKPASLARWLLRTGAAISDNVRRIATEEPIPEETRKLLEFYDKFQPGFQPGKRELQRAAMNGHVGVVKQFLEQGIDVNAQPEEDCLGNREQINSPPLHRAVLFDRIEVAKILMAAGANPMLKDQRGRSAFDLIGGKQTATTHKALEDILNKIA